MSNHYDKITNFLYKGLVLIFPLFFLPWTVSRLGADNFNKQNLLLFIVPVLIFIFILKYYSKGNIVIKRTPLDIPILFFGATILISSFFSIDKYASFFGGFGNINLPFFGFLAFILFYFFTVNYLEDYRTAAKIIRLVILTYTALIIIASYLLLGLAGSQSISIFFKLMVGSIEDLSVYIVCINLILFAYLISDNLKTLFKNSWLQMCVKIAFLLSLFLLNLINFIYAWIGFLLASLLIFVFVISIESKKSFFDFDKKKIFWGIVTFVLPFIFIIGYLTGEHASMADRLSQRLQLDHKNTSLIVKSSIKNNPIFGSGPDSFSYAFSRFRDQGMNDTNNWNLRYNQGSSFFGELVISDGILGFLAYLSIFISFAYCVYLFIKKRNNIAREKNIFLISISVAIFLILFEQILFNINYNIFFLEWILLGLFMVVFRSEINERNTLFQKISLNFMKRFDWTQSITLSLMILAVGWVVLSAFNLRFVLAEDSFRSGKESEENLIRAEQLNPYRYNYKINLSKFYLQKGISEASQASTEKNLDSIKNNFNKSIDWAKQAIKISPQAVVAYETLGMVYKQISLYSPESKQLAEEAFYNAQKLEPTNPVIVSELGKSSYTAGNFVKANEYLSESLRLKPDYYDAKYYQAKILAEQNQNSESLSVLNELIGKYDNIDVYYERGRVLYNMKKYEQAIDDFKKVLQFQPLHANAMYSLGLSYINVGNKDEGLYYLKKVLKLNYNNVELKKKIENLEKQ